MSEFLVYTEDGEQSIKNEFLIEHLEENGYSVIGDSVNSLDLIDRKLLGDIIEKFLVSDSFSREKIFNKIIKEENNSLSELNNFDIFTHLDEQGFDFLDHIDTQEIISHVNSVGYYVTEYCKH